MATPTQDVTVEKTSSVASTAEVETTALPDWTKKYDAAKERLPAAVSARLPTSEVAAQQVSLLSDKIDDLTNTSKVRLSEWRTQAKGIRLSNGEPGNAVLNKAWSVHNETNIALNVSLNQVGPLFYEVVLPNSTFERRTPNLYYALQLRPWTGPDTAYSPWSVTWPILAVAGPSAAAVSLLAIPFVALAAGGTALASLTSFGSAVGSSAASTATAVTSAGASAAGLAARAAALPGGKKIKGRLVDAAKRNVGEHGEVVTGKLVRYFAKPGAHAEGAAGETLAVESSTPSSRSSSKERKEQKRRQGKPEEVDVTGFELEKVLKCETGKSKVDKALAAAFANLSFKEKRFKTADDPVLRVTGGPELEEREGKQFLVFHPLVVERIEEVIAEAVPMEEVPPTADESSFLRDARIVPTASEAEAAAKHAPVHGEGTWAEERGKEGGEVDQAVEEAMKAEAAKEKGEHATQLAGKEGEPIAEETGAGRKSWFGWGK